MDDECLKFHSEIGAKQLGSFEKIPLCIYLSFNSRLKCFRLHFELDANESFAVFSFKFAPNLKEKLLRTRLEATVSNFAPQFSNTADGHGPYWIFTPREERVRPIFH